VSSAPSRRWPEAIWPEPLAAKVPEITFLFWVVKVLTTCGGEAISDYLAEGKRLVGGVAEVGLMAIAVVWQFRTRRYTAVAYWFLAYAIAIFGTGVSDALHLFGGIPYTGTTLLWAVVLALTFWLWYRSEGTLSIHSSAPPWATSRPPCWASVISRRGSCSSSSSSFPPCSGGGSGSTRSPPSGSPTW
jgi:uncharacterized membrane-anchored protein